MQGPESGPRLPEVMSWAGTWLWSRRQQADTGRRGRQWVLWEGWPLCISLPPLQAMNTLHELQFAREFKQAMQEAFPELPLALLSQTHYPELNLPEEPQPGKEAQETALFSPQR